MNNKFLNIPHNEVDLSIFSEDDYLFELLELNYSPYLFDMMDSTKKKPCVEIFYNNNSIKINDVQRKKINMYSADSADQALAMLLYIIKNIIFMERGYNLYHGASFTINNKNCVILGNSGCGKTTFVTYLLSRYNVTYLSEDIVIYNYINNSLVSYPRPLHIREESYNFLKKIDGINTGNFNPIVYNSAFKRYIVTPKHLRIDENIPVDYVFYLEGKHNKNSIELLEFPIDVILENSFLSQTVMSNLKSASCLVQYNNVYKIETKELFEFSRAFLNFL